MDFVAAKHREVCLAADSRTAKEKTVVVVSIDVNSKKDLIVVQLEFVKQNCRVF